MSAKFEGIVCPSCREPVAVVEYETPTSMTFPLSGVREPLVSGRAEDGAALARIIHHAQKNRRVGSS